MGYNTKQGNITAVVGLIKNQNRTLYRVISLNYKESKEKVQAYKGDLYFDWQVMLKKALTEQELIQLIKQNNRDNFINVTISPSGQITGKGASLSRFSDLQMRYVILTKLINNENKTIGYKIASTDGTIKNIPLNEMISYGLRADKKGIKYPVENAAFKISKEDPIKSSFYSAYPETPFFEERIFSGKKVEKVARASLPNQKKAEEIVREAEKVNSKTNIKQQDTKPKLSDIFNKEQLWQIYIGKNNGVDFRVYANPQLSVEQMQAIREGLESGVKPSDARLIAFPEYKADCMSVYLSDLKEGLNIKKYLNPKYNTSQLFRLSEAVELGLNIDKLLERDYTAAEMSEILTREKTKVYRSFN